jgi:hypothetical protein
MNQIGLHSLNMIYWHRESRRINMQIARDVLDYKQAPLAQAQAPETATVPVTVTVEQAQFQTPKSKPSSLVLLFFEEQSVEKP